jgi:pteridine reductase
LYERPQAQRLVDEVAHAFGRLDVVVASAANFDRIEWGNASEQELDAAWRRALELNLLAPFWLAHRAAPWLRASSGNIVVVTCSSATRPYRHYLPYTVSKAAVRHLVKALALELAPEVRVNAVAPGTVLPPDDMSDDQLQRIVRQVPLKRAGSAQDIADAVHYLSEASYVSGHELVVDGGATV